MRGRFGSPPWLEEGAGAGNRSQLARGGRKLGAAKVMAWCELMRIVPVDLNQNILISNHWAANMTACRQQRLDLWQGTRSSYQHQHQSPFLSIQRIVNGLLKNSCTDSYVKKKWDFNSWIYRELGFGQEQWFPTSLPRQSTSTSGRPCRTSSTTSARSQTSSLSQGG